MKKFNLFLACAFVLSGWQVSAQFLANSLPCEGDTVEVHLEYPLYNGFCDGNSTHLATNYYKYQIFYPTNLYNLVSGSLNVLTTETSLKFAPQSSSYTNPTTFEVRIGRYKVRNDGSGIIDQCGIEESIYITPKKKMTFNGPTELDNANIVNYSVTNVSGVNFTWHIPSTWAIASSNSNSSSVQLSPGGGGGGSAHIYVTSEPLIQACNWPPDKWITLSSCYLNGSTEYNFCEPETNWGNILATTDFQEHPNEFPRMVGDFNGDDKDDLIGFGYSGVIVGLSTGSNFNYNTWTSVFTNGNGNYNQTERPRMIGDFNGDGKDDIIGFGYTSTAVGLSNGSSFSTSGFASTPYFSYDQGFTGLHLPRFVGDFNGDGKTDVLACGHSSVSVGISTGSSFDVSSWSGGATFSTTVGGFGSEPVDTDRYPRMVGDFNGDKKTDIIAFRHTSVSVGLSTGSSFDVSTWTNSFTYGNDGILQSTTPRGIGDFDGNGKDDIILFGHTSVTVGLSTGTGFNVSTWTNKDFVNRYPEYWDSPQINPLGFGHKVLIYDVDNDGKDDLVGFNDGIYVAYSTGSGFKCAANDKNKLEFETNPSSSPEARFVGNFDNRDDDAEFIAVHANDIEVMDCDNCVISVANAAMTGHYAVAPETSGSNTVDVYKYCTNTLGLDLSATKCEDRYYIDIKPYDLSTGTTGTAVYQTGWIVKNAPQTVDLSTISNLQTNQLYKITYGVGPNTSTKSFVFRITGVHSNVVITPNQTRSFTTRYGTYTIGQYCNNVLSFSVNGLASGCYDSYRYEVVEVTDPLMVPNSNAVPVLQIPAGGGWNTGTITAPQQISMSGIVMGKIYRVYLHVRKNGVTSSSSRLIERSSCVEQPKDPILAKNLPVGENNGELEPVSLLYPNPSSNIVVVNPAGYKEEQIAGEIYDVFGKLVANTTLETGKDNVIELLPLSPGMYFIMLQGNDRIEKLSFIKQ